MEYEAREYEREYPYRRRTQTEPENEIKPYYMGRVILTQFLIFTVLFLIIFFMSRSGGERFLKLREIYGSIMQRDMSASEVWGEVKETFSFLTDSPLKNANEEEATETNNEASTEIAEETFAEAEENLDGAGGEDLIYPKENASFSPFYLSMPIVKPINPKRLSSPFGYRINPVTNEYGFHSGLDMAAPEGTPIKAAFDGTVSKAASSKARGNYVMIDSVGGIKTVYCHCSKLLVTEGQQITAGEIIAEVGSTGQATGPQLHLEIRINGIYYNPAWVFEF